MLLRKGGPDSETLDVFFPYCFQSISVQFMMSFITCTIVLNNKIFGYGYGYAYIHTYKHTYIRMYIHTSCIRVYIQADRQSESDRQTAGAALPTHKSN